MPNESFINTTGMVSNMDHDVGKCRIDFIDYTSSPTYGTLTKMGTLEGAPSCNVGRDVAEILAGVPDGVLAAYGIKDKGGFKATLQEFQIANLGKQLGLSDSNYTDQVTPTVVKTWNLGGRSGIRYFSARITKKRPDGLYLVITFHKGYFKPEVVLNHAAGPNYREIEFVAMVDSSRDLGQTLGSIVITETSPWSGGAPPPPPGP